MPKCPDSIKELAKDRSLWDNPDSHSEPCSHEVIIEYIRTKSNGKYICNRNLVTIPSELFDLANLPSPFKDNPSYTNENIQDLVYKTTLHETFTAEGINFKQEINDNNLVFMVSNNSHWKIIIAQ